jgi:hypothetical protein
MMLIESNQDEIEEIPPEDVDGRGTSSESNSKGNRAEVWVRNHDRQHSRFEPRAIGEPKCKPLTREDVYSD